MKIGLRQRIDGNRFGNGGAAISAQTQGQALGECRPFGFGEVTDFAAVVARSERLQREELAIGCGAAPFVEPDTDALVQAPQRFVGDQMLRRDRLTAYVGRPAGFIEPVAALGLDAPGLGQYRHVR